MVSNLGFVIKLLLGDDGIVRDSDCRAFLEEPGDREARRWVKVDRFVVDGMTSGKLASGGKGIMSRSACNWGNKISSRHCRNDELLT